MLYSTYHHHLHNLLVPESHIFQHSCIFNIFCQCIWCCRPVRAGKCWLRRPLGALATLGGIVFRHNGANDNSLQVREFMLSLNRVWCCAGVIMRHFAFWQIRPGSKSENWSRGQQIPHDQLCPHAPINQPE